MELLNNFSESPEVPSDSVCPSCSSSNYLYYKDGRWQCSDCGYVYVNYHECSHIAYLLPSETKQVEIICPTCNKQVTATQSTYTCSNCNKGERYIFDGECGHTWHSDSWNY